MGGATSTNKVSTNDLTKDSSGNINYNDSNTSLVLPYVTTSQWNNPSNYSFLDSRYDGKYAPITGGGYTSATDFNALSATVNNPSTGLGPLNTKVNNMQTTYNGNFTTIAKNLGLIYSTNTGTVTGTGTTNFANARSLNGTVMYPHNSNLVNVTFSQSFTNVPIVFLTNIGSTNGSGIGESIQCYSFAPDEITSSGFKIKRGPTCASTVYYVGWVAIGN